MALPLPIWDWYEMDNAPKERPSKVSPPRVREREAGLGTSPCTKCGCQIDTQDLIYTEDPIQHKKWLLCPPCAGVD